MEFANIFPTRHAEELWVGIREPGFGVIAGLGRNVGSWDGDGFAGWEAV
jgi:hypothetical protein